MTASFPHFSREVLAQVEVARDRVFEYREHSTACDDSVDGYLLCNCPVDIDGLLDDLVDAVRHLVWLAQLEEARVPSC